MKINDYSFELCANTLLLESIPEVDVGQMFNLLYATLNSVLNEVGDIPIKHIDYYYFSLPLRKEIELYLADSLKTEFDVNRITVNVVFSTTSKKALVLLDIVPAKLVYTRKRKLVHAYFTTLLTCH